MNKKIILVLLCSTLIASGCGNDQYAIEKKFYQAQKEAEKIFKNPQPTPQNQLQKVVNILEDFSKKYSKSYLAVESEFTVARLYMAKEEYGLARAKLESIINNHPKSQAICSDAIFLLGASYEMEDKWSLALQQYKKIMQEYPLTTRGFNIPIYIATHYKVKFQPDKMMAALGEAIVHYKALADKYPDSPLALNAHTLVASCYIEMKDWQNALSSFNTVLEKYKGKVAMDGILMNMAGIYYKELKDKVKAREALQRLIKEYPKSRLIKAATDSLKEIDKK